MNNNYLYRAKQQIQDPQILSIVAAKRAKLLAHGARPMIKTKDQEYLDIALLEIAEGLLSYEIPTPEEMAAEKARIAAELKAAEAEERAAAGIVEEEVIENTPVEAIEIEETIDFDADIDFESMEPFPEISELIDPIEI